MSVTKVRASKNIAASLDYLTNGAGQDRKRNLEEGTHRIAGMYCDLGAGPEALNAMRAKAAWITQQNPTRKVEGQAYIQSFAPDEFHVDNELDQEIVTELGRQLAKKMHPNSDCLVVTHTDGEGGAIHNHILVLNHDNATGKALTKYRRPVEVERANDEVMRENDCRVLPSREERIAQRQEQHLGAKQPDPGSLYWDNLRQAQQGVKPFNDRLYAQVRAAMEDPSTVDVDSFDAALEARGVTRETTTRGGKVATVYKMHDEEHPKRRLRRAKASNLAQGFTAENLPKMFSAKAKQQEAERQAQEAAQREAEEQARRAAEVEEKRAQQAEQAARAAAPPSLAEQELQAADEAAQRMIDAQQAGAPTLATTTPSRPAAPLNRPQPKRRQAGEDGLSL